MLYLHVFPQHLFRGGCVVTLATGKRSEYEERIQFKTTRLDQKSCCSSRGEKSSKTIVSSSSSDISSFSSLWRRVNPHQTPPKSQHYDDDPIIHILTLIIMMIILRHILILIIMMMILIRRCQSLNIMMIIILRPIRILIIMMMILIRLGQSQSCWRALRETWVALSTFEDLSVVGWIWIFTRMLIMATIGWFLNLKFQIGPQRNYSHCLSVFRCDQLSRVPSHSLFYTLYFCLFVCLFFFRCDQHSLGLSHSLFYIFLKNIVIVFFQVRATFTRSLSQPFSNPSLLSRTQSLSTLVSVLATSRCWKQDF